MADSIIHPRMLEKLPGFYPSRCTIQHDTDAGYKPSGQEKKNFVNLTGHVNIPCAVARADFGRSGGKEIRRSDSTVVVASFRIALRGHYPGVTERMHAVVAGQTYNILGVSHDSQAGSTYLDVEAVR